MVREAKGIDSVTPEEWDGLVTSKGTTHGSKDLVLGTELSTEAITELGKISEGVKHDSDKIRMDLLPPEALVSLGKVLTYGAAKYKPNNWRGVNSERYVAALLRHLVSHMGGTKMDDESGLTHLDHVLTNAAFLVAKQQEEK